MQDMLGRGPAVSVEEALRLIAANVSPRTLREDAVGLDDALARVLSSDVVSTEDLPAFARSSMDGFAVVSEDTFGSSESSPSFLNVVGEVAMGEEPLFVIKRGEAARISTGGMLPRGSDAVLMLEHAQLVDSSMVEALRSVSPGENVIQKGEDLRKGEVVIVQGRRLRAQDIAVLAGIGVCSVPVYEKPRVSIISTGDELVPPGSPAGSGLVRDSNSYSLAALVIEEGGIPFRNVIIRDDYDLLLEQTSLAASRSDMVLISGGSSVGSRDLTEKVMDALGRVLFHSVAIKPGKPLMVAVAGDIPIFGLPGHPRAVQVCFEVFVRPVLKAMTGKSVKENRRFGGRVLAMLSKSVRSSQGRQEIVDVYLEVRDGRVWAVPLIGKSGLLSNMLRADGVIEIPSGKVGVERGEEVEVRLR